MQAFEDSYFTLEHEVGLGYSPGVSGDQVSPFRTFNYYDETTVNNGRAGTSLVSFTDPHDGRLSSAPVEIHEDIPTPFDCADLCDAISCLSFDWDVFSLECLLHQYVHTTENPLRPSRKFQYWQRLGVFDSWWFEFCDIRSVSIIWLDQQTQNPRVGDSTTTASYLWKCQLKFSFHGCLSTPRWNGYLVEWET